MTEIFPQMAGVKIDYVWGGMVGFSYDRVPHAGEANPMRGFGFPKVPVPFYNGTAWFLPFAGAYYKAKDRLL